MEDEDTVAAPPNEPPSLEITFLSTAKFVPRPTQQPYKAPPIGRLGVFCSQQVRTDARLGE
jgi:hypothetical protein